LREVNEDENFKAFFSKYEELKVSADI